MAGLPKAVQEAAKRAEELAKKMAQNENPEEVIEEEEVVGEDETNLEDDLALEPEVEDEPEVDEPEEDIEPEPNDDDEEDDEPTVKREETLEYWRDRFHTLQGKYNSEVPELSRRVRQLEQENEGLKSLNVQPSDEEISKLNEADFEDYGEEFIALVKVVNALERRNKQLESLAQGFTTQSQELNKNTFEDRLTEIVPDWKKININPDFMTWLQNPDGYSGRSKHESLLNAYENLNVKLVGNIFKEFKKEFSIPEHKKRKPKNPLEHEIQPKPNKGEKQRLGRKKKGRIYSRADIAKFYRQKTEGKIDPKKAEAIERDIFLANQEGRITQ